MTFNHATGWVARLTGTPGDILRIAGELSGDEFQVAVRGQSLYLTASVVNRAPTLAAAQWIAFELVRLIEAAADLRFRILSPICLDSVEPDRGEWPPDPSARIVECNHPGNGQLSLLQILRVARERRFIRSALLARAPGSAGGLFEAYEAVTHEILNSDLLDFAAAVGTKEWLIAQGWITDEEDRRFLETVLHYRGNSIDTPLAEPLSPHEAQLFVRKVLTGFIARCARL
jgi:hypothetical protein